ncbi:MAG TPA: RDD family protein, partial [Burkholderiales bacterium]
ASLLFLLASPDAAATAARPLFQAYLLAVIGIYFTWFWTHGGQTVAMRAWRLRVMRRDGSPLSWRDAWLRLLLAAPSLGLGGLGVLWALVDRDGQFLHDRLASTMVVRGEE